MKLTNKYGLPEVFATFELSDKYSPGGADYSVTQLIDSPRIQKLRREHWENIEYDVSERLWSIMGSAVHSILEESAHFSHVSEERLYAHFNHLTISGQIDLLEDQGTGIGVTDFKTTSVWAILLDGDKAEWVNQLNCYAYLAEVRYKKPVTDLKICAIIRDWSRRKAEQDKEYPDAPILMIDIPIWPFKEREKYIQSRIEVHQRVEEGADYYCTPKERWARPDSYAVMKGKNKNASRVFKTGDEARAWKEKQKKPGDYAVVFRRGESVRCEADYCGVAHWCDQYREMRNEPQAQTPEEPQGRLPDV